MEFGVGPGEHWRTYSVSMFHEYCKVASANMSCLEPDPSIYRSIMKGKLDVYVLWPFGGKLIS